MMYVWCYIWCMSDVKYDVRLMLCTTYVWHIPHMSDVIYNIHVCLTLNIMYVWCYITYASHIPRISGSTSERVPQQPVPARRDVWGCVRDISVPLPSAVGGRALRRGRQRVWGARWHPPRLSERRQLRQPGGQLQVRATPCYAFSKLD